MALLSNLRDLGLNLMSEAVGIAVTVLVIDTLLRRREETKWAPARAMVAKHFAAAYSAATNAAFQIVAPLLEPAGSPQSIPIPPQKRCSEALRTFSARLHRFRTVVDLNNVALNATLMSHISEFLDAAEILEQRLQFLSNMYLPQNAQADFVCDSPVSILETMHKSAQHFMSTHPNHWNDRTIVPRPLRTVTELADHYAKACHPSSRLFLSPESYQIEEGRVPCVPDVDHLARIPTKHIKPGIRAAVRASD